MKPETQKKFKQGENFVFKHKKSSLLSNHHKKFTETMFLTVTFSIKGKSNIHYSVYISADV